MMRFVFGNGYEINNGFGCGINGGGGFGMMLIGLLLIGLIIYLVFRQPKRAEHRNSNEIDDSINILNLRFAKGEIDEDEFKSRKAAILK